MGWVYASLFLMIISLPILLLFLYGHRRKWPFRRLGPHVLTYAALFALAMGTGAGLRGWQLASVVLLVVGGGAVVFYMYAYVMDEVPKLRGGPKQ